MRSVPKPIRSLLVKLRAWAKRPIVQTAVTASPFSCCIIGCMFGGGRGRDYGGQGRGGHQYCVPAAWGPECEHHSPPYHFRAWTKDVRLWSMLTDRDPRQQAASIVLRPSGHAKETARTLTRAYEWRCDTGATPRPSNIHLGWPCNALHTTWRRVLFSRIGRIPGLSEEPGSEHQSIAGQLRHRSPSGGGRRELCTICRGECVAASSMLPPHDPAILDLPCPLWRAPPDCGTRTISMNFSHA